MHHQSIIDTNNSFLAKLFLFLSNFRTQPHIANRWNKTFLPIFASLWLCSIYNCTLVPPKGRHRESQYRYFI